MTQSLLTSKRIEETIKEFGYSSKKEFIDEAIREKIMELSKFQFFLISEKIRKGLEKKGIKAKDILKEIKS